MNQVRRRRPGDNFHITDYTRICEFHFRPENINVSIGIGRKTLKRNAVPTFKNPNVETPLRRSPRKRTITENILPRRNPENLMKIVNNFLRKEISDLHQENSSLRKEIDSLKTKIQELSKNTYNYKNVSQNEKFFKSETGIDTENFEILFTYLNPGENCANVKFYDSKEKNYENNPTVIQSPKVTKKENLSEKKQGSNVKLSPKNQLFLYLSWLKGGFSLNHTAWFFKFSKSTVSRYLITWSKFHLFFPWSNSYLATKVSYPRDNA